MAADWWAGCGPAMQARHGSYAVPWVDYRSRCSSVGLRSILTATQEGVMIVVAIISFPILSALLVYVQVR